MNLNSDPSRRRFLRQAGAAGLTFNIMKTSTSLGSEANSKVEVGCIGLGGRGSMIAGMIQNHGGFRITSVADYFPETAAKAGERLGVDPARRFSGLSGYRKLLASGVDAVILESPTDCSTIIAASTSTTGMNSAATAWPTPREVTWKPHTMAGCGCWV